MMLATEPVIVRFPARVLAIASVSQTVCGFENRVARDFNSMTAGTLLTKFDNIAVTIVKALRRCRLKPWPKPSKRSVRPNVFRSTDDQKEPDEKDEQAPVHFLVNQMRIACARDQHYGRTQCRDQRRRKTGQESDQNQDRHQTSLDQRCMLNLQGLGGSLGSKVVNSPAERQPAEN